MKRYELRLAELLEEAGYSYSWAAKVSNMKEYEIKAACESGQDLPGEAIFLICNALKRDINEFYRKTDFL